MPRWDGPRTGKEMPSDNDVFFSVSPVERKQQYAMYLLHQRTDELTAATFFFHGFYFTSLSNL